MTQPCPICGSADVEVRGSYRGAHLTFIRLERVHCRACGMVYATPMPSEVDLKNYNARYFTSAHGGQPADIQARAFFSGIARLRMAHVERYLHFRNLVVSNLLEFGPGLGFFARNWLAKYPQTVYSACETDKSCYTSLREIGVHLVDGSALAESINPVDLIVMSHVLEHVSNPVAFIKNATGNLRKGGVLFIEVPCRDWEHKKIDEPHLLFFDKKSIHYLLGKLGFDDIQASYHGQEIDRLRRLPLLRAGFIMLRSKLIRMGVVAPFAGCMPGMESLADPLERAAVAPFLAHRETQNPAWWLRVLAIKTI